MPAETLKQLIDALKQISPMPADDDPLLTFERVSEYEDLLTKISAMDKSSLQESPEVIPTLINSFGYGDGFELYWETLHLLETLPHDTLHMALRDGVRSKFRGTRRWCAFMLGRFRDMADIPFLIPLLADTESEVRSHATMALEMIRNTEAQKT